MFFAVAYYVTMRKGHIATIEVDDRFYADRPDKDDLGRFANELNADIVRLYRIGKNHRQILIDEFIRDESVSEIIEDRADVPYSGD